MSKKKRRSQKGSPAEAGVYPELLKSIFGMAAADPKQTLDDIARDLRMVAGPDIDRLWMVECSCPMDTDGGRDGVLAYTVSSAVTGSLREHTPGSTLRPMCIGTFDASLQHTGAAILDAASLVVGAEGVHRAVEIAPFE